MNYFKMNLVIRLLKTTLVIPYFLFLVGCGDVGFKGDRLDQHSLVDAPVENDQAMESGLASVNPPASIANGGLFFSADKLSGADVVVIESLIGQPLLSQFYEDQQYRVELGYIFHQGFVGEVIDSH